VVEGWKKKKVSRSEYFNAFYPIEIQGKKWRAISWTTAASLVSVIEMVANGKLPNKGFIKQEEIPFQEFLKTNSGKLFLK
jgi:saccharopine dehydrogenase-like NADP-dependent oxidoreductase